MEDSEVEIVVGTYENLLLGYRVIRKLSDGLKPLNGTVPFWANCYDKTAFPNLTLESSFTDDSHRGAIRCLTVSPNGILASSSTDDSIRLHSLKKRRDIGGLFQHSGSVNSIRFFKGGHMLSASEDGTIGLWKSRSWELLRLLKGHKSHVMAIAVHPSGKLGFSVGNDRSLFTWDFTTGKVAFKSHTEKVAYDVLFSHDGNHYILVYQKTVEICCVEDTKVIQEINFQNRINSVSLIKGNALAVGGEDRQVLVFDIVSGEELLKIDCGKSGDSFTGRIKCLSTFSMGEETYLATTTSTGYIKILQLDLNERTANCKTVLTYEAGVRVTCMIVYVAAANIVEDASPESIELTQSRKKKKVKNAKKRKREVIDGDDDRSSQKNETAEIKVSEESSQKEEHDEVNEKQIEKSHNDAKKRRKRRKNIKGAIDDLSTQKKQQKT